MKDKRISKQKGGWTLMELCVALIALAILVGISIQAIKPRKVMTAPFAYAGFYNLKQATTVILNRCYEQGSSGLPGCQANTYELPATDEFAIDAIKSSLTAAGKNPDTATLQSVPEIYCFEIANLFTLISDSAVQCGQNADKETVHTSLPASGNKGTPNFQASNMVAYYFLEGPWLEINKGAPEESNMTNIETAYFKPIFIDTNGDKGPNKLGEDQFPLRIYKNGTITPGSCQLYDDEKVDGENYPANLYCPSRTVSDGMGGTTPVIETKSWLESNYPFSYNMYRSYVPEGASGEDRVTKVLFRGLSYKAAACKSGRDNVLPREDFCGDNGADAATSEQKNDMNNFLHLSDCESGNEDAFCINRIAKPANPGLFRLPMM